MKVLELLDEIKEIVETSSGFPLTGKVLVDAAEILEIVEEIKVELPEEIQQAKWIKDERKRILDEAKLEYENTLKDARLKAESMVENDEITMKAKARADELTKAALENAKGMKLSAYDYMDNLIYGLQEKLEQMNVSYINEMYEHTQDVMGKVDQMLSANREEIKDMVYRIEMDRD